MIRFRKYRLAFKTPFSTASGSVSYREGILIEGMAQGVRFFGETAPLPGFSVESLVEAGQFLDDHHTSIKELFREKYSLAEFDEECIRMNAPPSVRFGLSSAMGEFLSQKNRILLSLCLNASSSPKIPVNAAFGFQPVDSTVNKVSNAWKEGFKTFKFKVGFDVEKEFGLLNDIRSMLPRSNIRLDANGAWMPGEALDNLKRFAPLRIEFCEQPVPAGDLKGLSDVQKESPVPVAADESVRSFSDAVEVLRHRAAAVLILKPMLIGTISEFTEIVKLAENENTHIVVTTSLESGIGRRVTAHLAASLQNQPYAHGLATGRLLKDDVPESREKIQDGFYHLS